MNNNIDNFQPGMMPPPPRPPRPPKHRRMNIFKIIQNISLYGMIAFGGIIALLMVSCRESLNNQSVITLISFLFILCISSFISMPWAKRFEKYTNENDNIKKKICFIFIILSGILFLFLILSDLLIVDLFFDINKNNGSVLDPNSTTIKLKIIQVVLIYFIQFIFASLIVDSYFVNGKYRIALQIIRAFSYVIFDIYFTIIVCALKINANKLDYNSKLIHNLFVNPMLSILVVSITMFLISNAWFSVMRKRSMRRGINLDSAENSMINEHGKFRPFDEQYHPMQRNENIYDNTNNNMFNQNQPQEDTKNKLKELKNLYDSQLITKEEYETKKKNILDNM